jgi:nitrogen regulation protein NR(I)
MPRLLVVDDEPGVLYSLERSLRSGDTEVITASTAREGIRLLREMRADLVILDVRLPDMSGLDAYDQIRKIDPRLPVVIITAFASTETAIEAMKRGAFEYLLKPLDLGQLREVVDRALELSRLSRVPAILDDGGGGAAEGDRMVGRSPAMQEVYKAIGRAAPQDVTVLILGESGTGKELVARAIFQHSRRKDAPFLAMNCAAIPEALLESELFGHEGGSFTGAQRRRIGKFEQADGGTLFLDEIGDMSPATQAKVLRVLQEKTFERLGSNETLQTDVRIIAATNQDLEEAVLSGRFRQDLFYRLNVFAIRLPPLRERLDDLPLLVDHFLKISNRELGKSVRGLSPEALQVLQQHSWPGNVRELQSTLKYALVKSGGEILTPDVFPDNLRLPLLPKHALPSAAGEGDYSFDLVGFVRKLLSGNQPSVYQTTHAAVDRILLEVVLKAVEGNQVEAARVLGISRNTLRSRLRALGLAVEKHISADQESEKE